MKKGIFENTQYAFLLLLAVSLPFELTSPLTTIGPFSISNLQLLLLLVLSFTAVSLLSRTKVWLLPLSRFSCNGHELIEPPRREERKELKLKSSRPLRLCGEKNSWQLVTNALSRFFQDAQWVWPDRYWLWLLPFVASLFLAALLAPQLQANALKAALRLCSGILLALAALQLLLQPHKGRLLGLALLAGGLLAAALGWWEIAQTELAAMSLFRSHLTRVGTLLRLTGPFGYANQTAMFLEATLPFLLAIAGSVTVSKLPHNFKILLLVCLFLLTLFYVQAIILTLSRAGAATVLVVSLLLTALLLWQQPSARRKMALWWLGLAGITAVLIATNLLLSDQYRLRLQGGNVDEWYRAQISVPPTLELTAGSTIAVPVTVTNEGSLIWYSQGDSPILLGARLLNEDGTQAHSELRWPFPESVRPQETVQMMAPFTAPAVPGVYELRWDVVEEDVTWFGANTGLYGSSQVTILPDDGQTSPPDSTTLTMSEQAAWAYGGPVPNRTTLWTLAVQMIGERPFLGIGMDNFRLIYGERLGNPRYDNTVHTNSFYLEMLVSVGLVGAVSFLLWSGGLLLDILRTLRRPNLTMWQAALAASLLTYYIHGFFDFFLLFNATGLLFWLLTALWLSEKRNHADRI